MATRTTIREGSEKRQRKLSDQPTPFVGLFLAPVVALILSWVIHALVRGFTFGPWHLAGSDPAAGGAIMLVTLAAVMLSWFAWHTSADRKDPLRYALTGSTFVIVLWMAILVWVGPARWWATFFLICGWIIASAWMLPRLRVLRNDPRGDEPREDSLTEKLGLRGYGFRRRSTVTDEAGNPVRTDFTVSHAPAGTIKPVQDGVPAFESLAAAPVGMSRATQTDRADRSNLTIIHRDTLAGRLPYPGPSRPGGSITDPLRGGVYDDAETMWAHLGGGAGFSPSGYGFMGMTRTGKTTEENQILTELITRRDVVILYLNRAKGHQDVRPILPGVRVAVIADDIGPHKAALLRVRNIITARQHELARHGISAWSARTCFTRPPAGMRPMPALVVHVGEADAVLESCGDLAVYIASKGLGVGVIAGWSLQRADAMSMPTGLRFNVGTWWCFGTGDDYSASFALGDATINAGAQPHRWKQSQPGKFYFEGPGVPEDWWPKVAKAYGGGTEEADAEHNAAILAVTSEWGPRMAALDQVSIDATAGWWDLAAAETDRIRTSLLGGARMRSARDDAQPPHDGPHDTARLPYDGPHSVPLGDELAERTELAEEIDAIEEVDGLMLYPDDPDDPGSGAATRAIDPSAPIEYADHDDLTWEEDKPVATSRDAAVAALDDALRALAADPELRDPAAADARTVLFRIDTLVDRYPFRSRPWFSGEVSRLADGERTCPPGLALSRADDQPVGFYRLTALAASDTP